MSSKQMGCTVCMVHVVVSTYSSIEDFGVTMQTMQPTTAEAKAKTTTTNRN